MKDAPVRHLVAMADAEHVPASVPGALGYEPLIADESDQFAWPIGAQEPAQIPQATHRSGFTRATRSERRPALGLSIIEIASKGQSL